MEQASRIFQKSFSFCFNNYLKIREFQIEMAWTDEMSQQMA